MEDKLLLAVAVVALVAVLSTLKSLIVTNWAMDTAVDRQHPPPGHQPIDLPGNA